MAPFIVIGVLGITALLVLAILGATRSTSRSFRCPITGRKVTAHFQQAIVGGRLLDVESCSAFQPMTAITCGTACLSADHVSRNSASY